MSRFKDTIFISVMVALASQLYIGLNNDDFRFSAGIIFLSIFLHQNESVKPISTAIVSGFMVYFLRLVTFYLTSATFEGVVLSFQIEILFYTFYGIIYMILTGSFGKKNLNHLFFIMFTSDLGANMVELVIRILLGSSTFQAQYAATLFAVAIIRASVAFIILLMIKQYGLLLVKEEHEERYRRLLWLTSQLKTEMYWMKRNTENIERIMSKSYNLYEVINGNMESESWATRALDITKDIHEIKKENSLAVRGITEITEGELRDTEMYLEDIFKILRESLAREVKSTGKEVELNFHIQDNLCTDKHFYLMSVLRNLLINAIDAVSPETRGGKVELRYFIEEDTHVFTIADNGKGMEEELLDHIFSPGFSTKIDYDTGEINRGLGLSIVADILKEEFRGSVSVDSKTGHGTEFRIRIPKDGLRGACK